MTMVATFHYGPALHTKYNIYYLGSFCNTHGFHLLQSANGVLLVDETKSNLFGFRKTSKTSRTHWSLNFLPSILLISPAARYQTGLLLAWMVGSNVCVRVTLHLWFAAAGRPCCRKDLCELSFEHSREPKPASQITSFYTEPHADTCSQWSYICSYNFTKKKIPPKSYGQKNTFSTWSINWRTYVKIFKCVLIKPPTHNQTKDCRTWAAPEFSSFLILREKKYIGQL